MELVEVGNLLSQSTGTVTAGRGVHGPKQLPVPPASDAPPAALLGLPDFSGLQWARAGSQGSAGVRQGHRDGLSAGVHCVVVGCYWLALGSRPRRRRPAPPMGSNGLQWTWAPLAWQVPSGSKGSKGSQGSMFPLLPSVVEAGLASLTFCCFCSFFLRRAVAVSTNLQS